ncbi:hypothetical protein EVAR_88632_1 [Eumeta japonica]|uniref:Uncharacterized protein n=1 Tax=Eumeta variegata TaxID=151549 RepID=A0A4C1X1G4_EUMVA|nr:hypothetical protein EVAR_88632_1 [Eumeta japonica]
MFRAYRVSEWKSSTGRRGGARRDLARAPSVDRLRLRPAVCRRGARAAGPRTAVSALRVAIDTHRRSGRPAIAIHRRVALRREREHRRRHEAAHLGSALTALTTDARSRLTRRPTGPLFCFVSVAHARRRAASAGGGPRRASTGGAARARTLGLS